VAGFWQILATCSGNDQFQFRPRPKMYLQTLFRMWRQQRIFARLFGGGGSAQNKFKFSNLKKEKFGKPVLDWKTSTI
jgi:hypothetical protein